MSELREVLTEVARQHDSAIGAFCICGAMVTDPEPHLAAEQEVAVLAWLAERLDGAREAVAETLSCGEHGEMTAYSETASPDHNRWSWRGDGHGSAIREPYLRDADAVLDAVRDALGGPLGAERDAGGLGGRSAAERPGERRTATKGDDE